MNIVVVMGGISTRGGGGDRDGGGVASSSPQNSCSSWETFDDVNFNDDKMMMTRALVEVYVVLL